MTEEQYKDEIDGLKKEIGALDVKLAGMNWLAKNKESEHAKELDGKTNRIEELENCLESVIDGVMTLSAVTRHVL